MEIQVLTQNWLWIVHTLRKLRGSIARKSLFWNPRIERSKSNQNKDLELRATAKDCSTINRPAQKRNKWREFVDVLLMPT